MQLEAIASRPISANISAATQRVGAISWKEILFSIASTA